MKNTILCVLGLSTTLSAAAVGELVQGELEILARIERAVTAQ